MNTISISRVFQPIPLQPNALIQLDEPASHHLARVLRATINDTLIIFNGDGGEYLGIITRIDKKNVMVQLQEYLTKKTESPLELYLAQGISRGEKMDYTIQKAVELGVKKILPLFTERSTVKLDKERREKKRQHWESIAISACEQSGRLCVPEIFMPQSLEKALVSLQADWYFVLSPTATHQLKKSPVQKTQRVVLLIGPEGGLSETEIDYVSQCGFLPLNLGPRILRTETAAVAAITALQCFFGDMS